MKAAVMMMCAGNSLLLCAGPAPSPAPAAGAKAASKPAKPGDASSEAAAAAASSARSYAYVCWSLAPGAVSLSSLGWQPADQQAVGASASGAAAAAVGGAPAGELY